MGCRSGRLPAQHLALLSGAARDNHVKKSRKKPQGGGWGPPQLSPWLLGGLTWLLPGGASGDRSPRCRAILGGDGVASASDARRGTSSRERFGQACRGMNQRFRLKKCGFSFFFGPRPTGRAAVVAGGAPGRPRFHLEGFDPGGRGTCLLLQRPAGRVLARCGAARRGAPGGAGDGRGWKAVSGSRSHFISQALAKRLRFPPTCESVKWEKSLAGGHGNSLITCN